MKPLVWLKRLDGFLAAVEQALAVLITVVLVLTMAAGVLARHVARIPSQALLEAAPMLVLWLALIGAGLALHRNRHIRLELFMRFAPLAVRTAVRIVAGFFCAAVMGLLSWTAFDFVCDEIALLGPRGWAAAIFPIFFAIAAFRCLVQALSAPGVERGAA